MTQQQPVAGARAPRRSILRDAIDGREVARVPLSDGRYAVLDGPCFDRLTACGLNLDWYVYRDAHGAEHVRAPSYFLSRYPVLEIARLMCGAAPEQRVTYRDGDRLNLRLSNIVLSSRRTGVVAQPGVVA